ncbi:MAG: diguanylate cyclase [Thermoanaerobacteraceae bacterium]|nr:diguanylate cyclase [Thermoanaerobacteraceae bacterium]
MEEKIMRIKTLEKHEQQIREFTIDLETVFNGTQDAMFLVRVENGGFRYVRNNISHQKLTGFSLAQLQGKTPVELAGEEIGEKVEANYRRCVEAGTAIIYEETLKLPGGERVWLTSLTPVFENGKVKYLVGSSKDITLQKRAEEELYREKELLRATLLSISDGVVTTDEKGRITAINRAAEEITGWSEEEAKSRSFAQVFKLVNETTGEEAKDPVEKVLETGKITGLANHTALIAKDGRKISISYSTAPIKDEKGQTFGEVMVFRDVTQEKAWQEKILYLSYHDSLTGLYNRRFMEEQIKRLELPLAVIMTDVNGLKLVNDAFGNEEGDKLLKKAAEILKESCRKEDFIARWGGDEFLILLPRTSAKTAEEIIERIKNRCLKDSDGPVQLSIAMGYAVKAQVSESLGQVIKEAEEWMYRHKLLECKSYHNGIINTLLATLFSKSMETEEHAERLKNYCLTIGREMELSVRELDELALLAVLHDIGKIGIKESVLQKPGPLNAAEWEEMKKHPEIGYRIARNIPELSAVAEYILAHHERWDGKGYPRGLKGEEIPLLCRILAVADAYDAMTSDRPYRKAMSSEEAVAELKRNAGIQFDPEVVRIFLASNRKKLCSLVARFKV